MRTGRRGFLESAGLTIAGLWTLGSGLAKLNGVRAFFESVASLRGPAPVVRQPNTVVATASVAWESLGRATVSFEGVAITPGTGVLGFGA
jgi:hypothetical protein